MNRMILVVGGAGYIGSHVNKELHRQGYDTLVYDNLSSGHREAVKWGRLVQGDVRDAAALRQVFSEYKIEAVFHFAAFSYVGESVVEPEKYYNNNVMGTLTLLQVMREFGVRWIVFSSTCAVYGVPQELPLTEKNPLSPVNPYGRSKLMIEQIMADYTTAYGLCYAALRYFNAAGADAAGEIGEQHSPETHLIPLVLAAAADRQRKISIFGTDYPTPDGTCVRDYVHVSDLAQAHVLALQYIQRHDRSQAFNLSTGRGYSVREIIEAVKKVTEREVTVAEADRRPGDPPQLFGSGEMARNELGWKPEYLELDKVICTAWNWYQGKGFSC